MVLFHLNLYKIKKKYAFKPSSSLVLLKIIRPKAKTRSFAPPVIKPLPHSLSDGPWTIFSFWPLILPFYRHQTQSKTLAWPDYSLTWSKRKKKPASEIRHRQTNHFCARHSKTLLWATRRSPYSKTYVFIVHRKNDVNWTKKLLLKNSSTVCTGSLSAPAGWFFPKSDVSGPSSWTLEFQVNSPGKSKNCGKKIIFLQNSTENANKTKPRRSLKSNVY